MKHRNVSNVHICDAMAWHGMAYRCVIWTRDFSLRSVPCSFSFLFIHELVGLFRVSSYRQSTEMIRHIIYVYHKRKYLFICSGMFQLSAFAMVRLLFAHHFVQRNSHSHKNHFFLQHFWTHAHTRAYKYTYTNTKTNTPMPKSFEITWFSSCCSSFSRICLMLWHLLLFLFPSNHLVYLVFLAIYAHFYVRLWIHIYFIGFWRMTRFHFSLLLSFSLSRFGWRK